MIRISGGSDDIIVVEGCDGANEFNSYQSGPIMWRGNLIAPGGTDIMRIHAVLADGCWSFALGQANEDLPFPEWPVKVRQHTHSDYSVLLEIDAPVGTRLDNIWPTGGDRD
jgi:hypothetical protein